MSSEFRIQRVRDDLLRAMKSGEVSPDDGSLYQLTSDLLVYAFPEVWTPEKLDSFSLLVGFAAGSAIQKFEQES